jgi:hypothetical protein
MNTTYIRHVKTENTGGGCMVDFVILDDRRVIAINDEMICVYQSEKHFWDSVDSGDSNGLIGSIWINKTVNGVKV